MHQVQRSLPNPTRWRGKYKSDEPASWFVFRSRSIKNKQFARAFPFSRPARLSTAFE